MKLVTKLLVVSAIISLTGCASAPWVDLSDSIYRSNTIANTADSKMAKLTIENTADFSKKPKNTLFGDSHMPIIVQPILPTTIEKDIRRFFEDRLAYDTNSEISILVNIKEANSYYNRAGVDKIPFVGLTTVNRDRDIGMNLKFSISLIKSGKEFAHYLYDKPIIITGKATTMDRIVISYKELVNTYRKEIFSELDSQIIEKYFVN